MPGQMVKPRHFELRMSILFAAMLIPAGTHLPYFPLWLEAKGFDPEQIAVILSAPMFVRVVTTPLISTYADKARDRATVCIALAAASVILCAGYFLPPTYALVLAVSLLLSVVWTPQVPIVDSIALSGVRRFGSNYANMRIWGSIAFFCSSLAGGYVLAATSAESVLVIMTVAFAGALAACALTPRLGRPRRASSLSATDLQAAPELFSRYFLCIAAGSGLLVAAHGFLYGFLSIYWKSIGISDGTIGWLWTWGVISEVVIFMIFTRVFGRYSVSAVLIIAGIAAIVRWLAFPLIWPAGLGVPGFFLVQTLHALSTGLILIAIQKAIAETVSEERTGAAQGIAFFTNGVSMAAVTLVSGPLYEQLGVDGFFAMVAISLCGMALVLCAGQPQSAGSGGETSEPR